MKRIDLLRSSWIETDIGPCSPAVALRSARRMQWLRGDWDIATFCFLHALVQTAVVLKPELCMNRSAWFSRQETPPENLETWLDFDFGELPWQCPGADSLVPVSRLLPEAPGDNTLRKTSDVSYWREYAPSEMTLPQAVAALISDNLWGTRIGLGHRQGARGEQAVTTLLEPANFGASLWQKIWLNVLPSDVWIKNFGKDLIPFSFPWNEQISEKEITPENAHSLTILWQMPRRWRLKVDEDGKVRQVFRLSWGRHYSGWSRRHPLTPYLRRRDGTWVSAKVNLHAGFDDWAAYALSARSDIEPALVVREVVGNPQLKWGARLRCCGWALADGGAIGSWVDNVTPYVLNGSAQTKRIEASLAVVERHRGKLATALGLVRKDLRSSCDKVWIRLEQEFCERLRADRWVGWDRGVASEVRSIFWDVIARYRIDLLSASRGANLLAERV